MNLADSAGNFAFINSADLAKRGFPATIQVTSIEDTTPPELLALTVSPAEVDTTQGPATVRVQVEIKDDLSGFEAESVEMYAQYQGLGESYALLSLGKGIQTGGTDLQPVS